MIEPSLCRIPNLKYREVLISAILLGVQFPLVGQPVLAQNSDRCQVRTSIDNQALFSYQTQAYISGSNPPIPVPSQVTQTTNLRSSAVKTTVSLEDNNQITVAGIENVGGDLAIGSVAGALSDSLANFNFSKDESRQASLAAIRAWSEISDRPTLIEIGNTAKEEIIASLPDKRLTLESLGGTPEATAKNLALLPLKNTLIASGVNPTQVQEATDGLQGNETISEVFNIVSGKLPQSSVAIARVQKIWNTDLENIRKGVAVSAVKGDRLAFKFKISNQTSLSTSYQVPTLEELQTNALTGPGTVKEIKYQFVKSDGSLGVEQSTTPNQRISVPPQGAIVLKVLVEVGQVSQDGSALGLKISECDGTSAEQTLISSPPIIRLTDPAGKINSCTGGDLADYNGFSVGLYEPAPGDLTGGITGASPLTGTEFPDIPGNNRPKGIFPNVENSNPFFLTNSDRGRYSFLLDKSKGQLNKGRVYILLVNPPTGSEYGQRRIRIVIGDTIIRADGAEIVNYTATSLDGLPIRLIATTGQDVNNGDRQEEGEFGSFVKQGEILVEDADTQGLSIAAISLSTSVCEDTEIKITKTGDRAAAEPGDTVIYRLSVRNLTQADVNNLQITDTLPLGFRFVPNSVRAETGSVRIPVTTRTNGSQITFEFPNTRLQTKGVLNIAYAATLTPDAIRGSGENIANVNGQRADNLRPVKDGPAIYKLRIRPGILTDTGTIIGRVFVDKNFDGEQQPGEPGVPNAVVFMDDGNRIVTDPNGLFSVANVQPGYRTGVLDMTSLEGYTLAPNLYFNERNSQSRLVHLAPGGMVRMNFGVAPAAKSDK